MVRQADGASLHAVGWDEGTVGCCLTLDKPVVRGVAVHKTSRKSSQLRLLDLPCEILWSSAISHEGDGALRVHAVGLEPFVILLGAVIRVDERPLDIPRRRVPVEGQGLVADLLLVPLVLLQLCRPFWNAIWPQDFDRPPIRPGVVEVDVVCVYRDVL